MARRGRSRRAAARRGVMAANSNRYTYRGEEGETIPRDATHIFVHESVTVIRAWAFNMHPNIVEVVCHEAVEKIEEEAFGYCLRLRRVIMPGVKKVENDAFCRCYALTEVEWSLSV